MIDLKGKVAVVFGLANKRSIAWAICQKLSEAGATLVIGYQSERLQRDAQALAAELPGASTFQCDVAFDDQIDAAFAKIAETHGAIHTLVHAIGFAPNIKNPVLQTAREDFRVAHDISVYSLIAISRAAVPLMTEGGSILTLTYYGSEKVIPGYNIMGPAKAALEATVRYLAAELGAKNIRVNAISAGAIKTLAARGIGDLQTMLDVSAGKAPLHRNVDVMEVGKTALFLSSDLASGITGEITFVDCGVNVTGL
jgi:enoyl-[acyl-carrier protein] reductase I